MLRIHHPVGSFAHVLRDKNPQFDLSKVWDKKSLIRYQSAFHFVEALVEAEVVPDGILPSHGCLPVVREVLSDPGVDVPDGQCFGGRRLDGEEDEGGEGVRGLGRGRPVRRTVCDHQLGWLRTGRLGRSAQVALHGAHDRPIHADAIVPAAAVFCLIALLRWGRLLPALFIWRLLRLGSLSPIR